MNTTCVHRRQQRGQSLPLVLIFLLVLCIGLLVVFNTGQIVNKKVELTNTADAAAYSVAVQQARAWNTAAYMNRGRIANEVTVAQLVSLNSWATQINVTAYNVELVSNILSTVPYVGAAFRALARVARIADRQVMRPLRQVLREGSDPLITLLDQLNSGYAHTAEIAIDYVSTADALFVANDVVERNSPQAQVSTHSMARLMQQVQASKSDWLEEFKVPGTRGAVSTGGERYRNLVMESRDRFTVSRRDDAMLFGIFGFRAYGGTDMVDYRRWSAVDTNNFEVDLWVIDFKIPVGWAGAQALPRNWGTTTPFFPGMDNGRGWYSDFQRRRLPAYGGLRSRDVAARLAERDPGGSLVGGQRQHAYFTGYNNGIAHDYHDLRRDRATTPGEGPVFTVEVETRSSQVRTSDRIEGMPAGRMEMPDGSRGNRLKALSSAQVYFNRPLHFRDGRMFQRFVRGRRDDRYEMGSLFSPYWQARLVDTPDAIKNEFNLVGGVMP
ncbi:TadE/TadG family type IV pilus assembly protein [Luteimonas sp. e5]